MIGATTAEATTGDIRETVSREGSERAGTGLSLGVAARCLQLADMWGCERLRATSERIIAERIGEAMRGAGRINAE